MDDLSWDNPDQIEKTSHQAIETRNQLSNYAESSVANYFSREVAEGRLICC